MRNRIVSILLSGLLVSSAPLPVFAETTTSEASVAQERLDGIESDFNDLLRELNDVSESQELTRAKLDELRTLSEQQEATYDQSKKDLARYVAASYKAGPTNLLEILLNSSSFEELSSNIYYADKIWQEGVDAVNAVNDARFGVDAQIADLEQAENDLRRLSSEVEAKYGELSDKLEEQQAYVSTLDEETRAQVTVADLDVGAHMSGSDDFKAAEATQSDEPDPSEEMGSAQSRLGEEPAQQEVEDSDMSSGVRPTEEQAEVKPRQDEGAGAAQQVDEPFKGDNTLGERIVAIAKTQLGVPYQVNATQWGQLMDCSGFTYLVYQHAGYDIPRCQGWQNAGQNSQMAWVRARGDWKTSIDELEPGDLVFYGSSWSNTAHVGIYVGNGMNIEEDSIKVSIREVYNPAWHPTWHNFVGGGSPV